MNRKKALTFLPYILLPLLIIFAATYYADSQKQVRLEYYEIVQLFDQGDISEYTLNMSNGSLEYYLKDDEAKANPKTFKVPSVNMFTEDIHNKVIEFNRQNPENMIKAKYVQGSTGTLLASLAPSLFIFVILGALIFYMIRRTGQTISNENNRAMSFGKARVKAGKR